MRIYINCCASITLMILLSGCNVNEDRTVYENEPIKKNVFETNKDAEKAKVTVVKSIKVPTTEKEIVTEVPAIQKETIEAEEPVLKEEPSDQNIHTNTPKEQDTTEKIPTNIEHVQQDAIKTNIEDNDMGCQVFNPITGRCED